MPALWMTASKVPIALASPRHLLHLGRAGQVGDEDLGEARQLAAQRVGLLRVAGVTDDSVAVVDEAAGGVAAEAVVGAGDEDDRHHEPIVSTTRKRAAPLIIRAYPSAARSSG